MQRTAEANTISDKRVNKLFTFILIVLLTLVASAAKSFNAKWDRLYFANYLNFLWL